MGWMYLNGYLIQGGYSKCYYKLYGSKFIVVYIIIYHNKSDGVTASFER